MCYTLFELSQNQSIQDKARDNVKSVLDRHEGIFTYEAVMEMAYIENCLSGEKHIQVNLCVTKISFYLNRVAEKVSAGYESHEMLQSRLPSSRHKLRYQKGSNGFHSSLRNSSRSGNLPQPIDFQSRSIHTGRASETITLRQLVIRSRSAKLHRAKVRNSASESWPCDDVEKL